MNVWRGIALILCCSLTACLFQKEARPPQDAPARYKDWAYSAFTTASGQVVHLAETTTAAGPATPGRKLPTLFIYATPDACGTHRAAIGLDEAPGKLGGAGRFRNLAGQVHVDEGRPYPVAYQYDVKAGATDVVLELPGFFANEALLREIRTGQMIRFRVTLGREERVLAFSLRNILTAVTALQHNCVQAAAHGPGSPPARPAQPADEAWKYFQ